jgi:tetratricopeptide (TPR) repeat protein
MPDDPKRPPIAAAAAATIVAVGLLAYSNSFDVPLVFDDSHLVERVELHATALSPSQLARAAVGFPVGRWLAYVTLAADHAVHGLRPFGYHAVNLAIHLGAALLLFAVALELLRALRLGDDTLRRLAAALGALIFVSHPVQTSAVTYVIQRMTSLGAFFALAALLVWLRARRMGRIRAPVALGAVLLWYLAFACKESYVVLPAIALLIEWCAGLDVRSMLSRRPIAWSLAGLALAGAVTALFVRYLPVIVLERREYSAALGDRLLTQGRVIWHYLSLLAAPLPSRLHVDYAWEPSTGLLSPPSTLPALLGLLALAASVPLLRRRAPLAALAVGWFLIALSVEQSVLPIDFVFEHRLYFAGAGFAVLAGWYLASWRPSPDWATAAVTAPLIAGLALGTWTRNETWRDPVKLFSDSAAKGVGRARALINGAVEARRRGRLDDATAMFLEAARLEPGVPHPYANLGNIAAQRGRIAEAERWYREALARDPNQSDVLYDLGVLLAPQGRTDEAIEAYERAIAAAPRNSDARVNLAILVAEQRHDRPRALALLDETISLDPGSPTALMNRAIFRADAGNNPSAAADALQALRLVPENADAHYVLAYVRRAEGQLDSARRAAMEALRLRPDHPDALSLLRSLDAAAPSQRPAQRH